MVKNAMSHGSRPEPIWFEKMGFTVQNTVSRCIENCLFTVRKVSERIQIWDSVTGVIEKLVREHGCMFLSRKKERCTGWSIQTASPSPSLKTWRPYGVEGSRTDLCCMCCEFTCKVWALTICAGRLRLGETTSFGKICCWYDSDSACIVEFSGDMSWCCCCCSCCICICFSWAIGWDVVVNCEAVADGCWSGDLEGFGLFWLGLDAFRGSYDPVFWNGFDLWVLTSRNEGKHLNKSKQSKYPGGSSN